MRVGIQRDPHRGQSKEETAHLLVEQGLVAIQGMTGQLAAVARDFHDQPDYHILAFLDAETGWICTCDCDCRGGDGYVECHHAVAARYEVQRSYFQNQLRNETGTT